MEYKENTEEELRNKVMEALSPVTMAAFTAIDVLTALMKAEYNRGYAEGYTIAYSEHS
jgi:hypothetical protein